MDQAKENFEDVASIVGSFPAMQPEPTLSDKLHNHHVCYFVFL